MSHNLIVDIGNSLIKLAVFNEASLIYKTSHEKVLVRDINNLRSRWPFESAIVSSVRDKAFGFIQHLERNYHLTQMSHRTKVPVTIKYKTPKTLGLDRLAAAVGGNAKFSKSNVLVIDMGTCIKYDFIDADGQYWGGNIAPGLFMRINSMHDYTAKLPLVKPKFNEEILGVSTKTALQNGVVWGIKCEIEHFIKTLTKKRGKLKVILTGGDAQYFGDIIESKIFVFPNLVLEGLNQILMYNQSNK